MNNNSFFAKDNPNYSGKCYQRKIVNPDFFEDVNPFTRLTTIVSKFFVVI